jgi:predicted DNA binding CopG/RHH family protein
VTAAFGQYRLVTQMRASGESMKARKKIPTFKDEDAEREFWSREDTTEYLDWSRAERVTLPNLRPSLRTISLRLPEAMIAELKLLANKRDVPYQSLLKVFLADRIREELAQKRTSRASPAVKRAG